MIYVVQNVAGAGELLINCLKEKYNNCVWSEVKIPTSTPLLFDKWLMRVSARKLKSSGFLAKILDTTNSDFLIECDRNQDMTTVIDSLTNEIIKIKTEVYNHNFEYNETLKKCEKMIVPDKIDTALDYYLNNVLTFSVFNPYKLEDNEVRAILLYHIFEHSEITSFIEYRKTLMKYVPRIEHLASLELLMEAYRISPFGVLNEVKLLKEESFKFENAASISAKFKKKGYVTIENLPLQLFSFVKTRKKQTKNEIYQIVYLYGDAKLKKSFKDFGQIYLNLFNEYYSGELTNQNASHWLAKKGQAFKIKSEFLLKKYLLIFERFSLEKMLKMLNIIETEERPKAFILNLCYALVS